MKSGRQIQLGAFTFLALLSTAIPSSHAQAPAIQRGGTVIFAIGSDPTTLNRNLASNFPDGTIACVVNQGLTRLDGRNDVKPLLAKSWTQSDDGRRYTFELNKAKWEDGRPFTSEDVKYSLLQISAKYSPSFVGAGRAIDTIETPADDRVIVNLKQPYGPFLSSLSCQNGGAILPKHIFEGTNVLTNPATTSHPIGLGPFVFKEWKRGDYIRLVRNSDYWEPGKPYLDEIVAKIIPDAAGRTRALQAGEIDFLSYYYFPTSDVKNAQNDPKLRVVAASSPPGGDEMAFNVERKPFSDKRVRQALFTAIDREYLVRTVYLGLAQSGSLPIDDRLALSRNPKVDLNVMYAFNPARANDMLEAAGYKRGADGTRFKLDFLFLTDTPDNPVVAQAIKSMWSAVGVNANLIPLERTAGLTRIFQSRDFDVGLFPAATGGDPAIGFAPFFLSKMKGATFGNSSGYSNPTVDQLFEEGEAGASPQARAEAYQKIQVILAEDLPVVPIRERLVFNGQSPGLRGVEDENFLTTWRDAWLAH